MSVDAQIEKFGATDPDAVVAPIKDDKGNDVFFGSRNIHYYAAAATLYGGMARGGYEYEGMTYDAKNDHIEGYGSCSDCHDSHTLEVKVEQCAFCHEDVSSTDDLKDIRMVSSAPDYDGDGNVKEGMYYEIEGLQAALLTEIQAYAAGTAGSAILYDSASYPYWFVDANANGSADEGEIAYPNSYASWTPRLLKATYNYQLSMKDPGRLLTAINTWFNCCSIRLPIWAAIPAGWRATTRDILRGTPSPSATGIRTMKATLCMKWKRLAPSVTARPDCRSSLSTARTCRWSLPTALPARRAITRPPGPNAMPSLL